MRRNAAWKKELLGEEYELISNKFTTFINNYKHILGNDRKITLIFIACYGIFVIIMEIVVLISSAIYQILILLWFVVFIIGWSLTLKQFQSYDDGLGISKEGKNLKYIAWIFVPIYAMNIILWRLDIIPEEIYRIVLCLLVTMAVFVGYLMMIWPIMENYNDILFAIQEKNDIKKRLDLSSHHNQLSSKSRDSVTGNVGNNININMAMPVTPTPITVASTPIPTPLSTETPTGRRGGSIFGNTLKLENRASDRSNTMRSRAFSEMDVYNKYKLKHFLADYQAFVLFSRHCVKFSFHFKMS